MSSLAVYLLDLFCVSAFVRCLCVGIVSCFVLRVRFSYVDFLALLLRVSCCDLGLLVLYSSLGYVSFHVVGRVCLFVLCSPSVSFAGYLFFISVVAFLARALLVDGACLHGNECPSASLGSPSFD